MAMTGGTAYKVRSKYANYGSASWAIDLYVYVVQGTQSVANNTTALTLGMYVKTPGADYNINWTDYGGSYLGIGAFAGGSENLSSFTKNASGGGTIWLKENVSVTVKHDADGTAKGVPIKWKWGVNSPWGQYVTPSGTLSIDLPTIPRVSSVSASNGTIGTVLNVNISRESSSFTHTLTYKFGDTTGTIATKTDKTTVSWTPPMSLCNEIPSAASGTCTITCDTYSGTTKIGADTVDIKLSVPSSVKLECSSGWATVSPYNTGTAVEGINAYISGYSKADVDFDTSKISTANSYGATVKSYKVVYNGAELASPYRTGTLNAAGEFSIICYVYDTRGRSTSTTLKITVQEYTRASLKNVSVFRCDSSGTKSKTGTYISVTATAVYTSLGGYNTPTLRVRYKTASGSFGSWTALTSGTRKIIGDGQISITTSYVVEIDIYDSIRDGVPNTINISTAEAFFHGIRGGKGAAFGKFAELVGWFDIAFKTIFRDEIDVNNQTVYNVKTPTADTHAVNKKYVDEKAAAITLSSLGLTVTASELNGGKIKYTAIPNNANVDDYRTPGFYRSSSASNTINNIPIGCSTAFELSVGSINNNGYYCSQIIKDHSKNAMWIRTQKSYNSLNWTEWDAFNIGDNNLVTLLWSGDTNLSSASVTVTNGYSGGYSLYIFVWEMSLGSSKYHFVSQTIPRALISTTDIVIPFVSGSNYKYMNVKYSGNNLVLSINSTGGNGGDLRYVYGIK